MLTLVKSSIETASEEQSIINANPFFNRISKGKEELSVEEITEEIEQASKVGAHRYLIKDNQSFIGILEYLLLNPNDQCTWLGLLVIRSDLHAMGYGSSVLALFYDVMKGLEVQSFRIGVIKENEPAHRFWRKHGFQEVSLSSLEGKTIVVYEKTLD